MKQKSKTIKPSEFEEMVSNHKNREVTPPDNFEKNDKGEIVRKLDKVEALQTWFKTAKDPALSGQSVFNGVETQDISVDLGTGKEMLYKGKKK